MITARIVTINPEGFGLDGEHSAFVKFGQAVRKEMTPNTMTVTAKTANRMREFLPAVFLVWLIGEL